MKTCFCIMPFHERFNDIGVIIEQSARQQGFNYVRGDMMTMPGDVMEQIKHEIKASTVVVADISEENPNVFYELGIAHFLKKPVVIISQRTDSKRPYDVLRWRIHRYDADTPGRQKLQELLPGWIAEASAMKPKDELWNVIKGAEPRTTAIVRSLTKLIGEAGSRGLQGRVIRVAATLGSFSVSDLETSDELCSQTLLDALRQERDTLREALLLGAELRAVLNPPQRFARSERADRIRLRYERLIGLFEGRSDLKGGADAQADDVKVIKERDFVLSPISMPNLFIIDDNVAYEGMNRSLRPSYEMTHCETDPEKIATIIKDFEQHYAESRDDMRRTHPPDGRLVEQLKTFLRMAMQGR